MAKARDTQRQKVYDSEGAAFGVSKCDFDRLADVQRFADKVLASKVLRRHYPRAARLLVVTDGRSRSRGGYTPRNWSRGATMAMPRLSRSRWYVLHEIAHHLVWDRDCAAHDWRFCEAYLRLVRAYIGPWAEEALLREFKARKVKYRPPRKRQLTDEQREAATQRLLAYNAAKAAQTQTAPAGAA